MIINVLGAVGAGKSTNAKAIAEVFNIDYIPEVEIDDKKFWRLLEKRNTTNTERSKYKFQKYTLKQAFKRQKRVKEGVIDVPLAQPLSNGKKFFK